MNFAGEPDGGNLHVRFEEGRQLDWRLLYAGKRGEYTSEEFEHKDRKGSKGGKGKFRGLKARRVGIKENTQYAKLNTQLSGACCPKGDPSTSLRYARDDKRKFGLFCHSEPTRGGEESPIRDSGNSHSSGESQIKTFAMSRIRKIEETGEVFEVADGFDAKAHMRRAFGIVAGDKLFRVKLRFSPTVSAYIRERVWHPTQVVKERKDGDIDLEFETGGWKELVRWILSWQPDVKVLAPRRLRERVKEKMKQALSRK